jgi:hypothetical protein
MFAWQDLILGMEDVAPIFDFSVAGAFLEIGSHFWILLKNQAIILPEWR